jgi:hypothetical protein
LAEPSVQKRLMRTSREECPGACDGQLETTLGDV